MVLSRSLAVLALLVPMLVAEPLQAADLVYAVEFVGVPDEPAELAPALRDASGLVATEDRPAASVPQLRRRAERDVDALEEALGAFGYWGAQVGYAVEETAAPPRGPDERAALRVRKEGDAGAPARGGEEAPSVRVVFKVDPGPRYRLARYDIRGSNPALTNGSVAVSAEDLGVTQGMPAESRPVSESFPRLLSTLARQGFPLARIADQRIIIDHAADSMAVALRLDTGPPAAFGPLTITGLETVDRQYVLDQIPWAVGDRFNSDEVARARSNLVATNLFSSVRIAHASEVDAAGRLPMTVTVVEAPHRSVGAGARYATTEGFSANLFWEHRNLLHGGERLRVDAFGGETAYGATVSFRKPSFLDPKQALLVDAQAREDYGDAVEGHSGGVALSVSRAFSDAFTGAAGLSVEYSDIKEDEETFTLVGLPLSLTWDTTDDLFDPSKGNRLTLNLTPYASVIGSGPPFVSARLYDSTYLRLDDDGGFILALWGRIGSIFGAEEEGVPRIKRLYGGGGGSVRAYGYQQLGPEEDGDPAGGLSQIEIGTELRLRLSEQWGAVAFLEGGNVYEDSVPDFSEPIQWGVGVGARYFTSVGPIRVDIATPLNRRADDDWFQLYVSLGQAF